MANFLLLLLLVTHHIVTLQPILQIVPPQDTSLFTKKGPHLHNRGSGQSKSAEKRNPNLPEKGDVRIPEFKIDLPEKNIEREKPPTCWNNLGDAGCWVVLKFLRYGMLPFCSGAITFFILFAITYHNWGNYQGEARPVISFLMNDSIALETSVSLQSAFEKLGLDLGKMLDWAVSAIYGLINHDSTNQADGRTAVTKWIAYTGPTVVMDPYLFAINEHIWILALLGAVAFLAGIYGAHYEKTSIRITQSGDGARRVRLGRRRHKRRRNSWKEESSSSTAKKSIKMKKGKIRKAIGRKANKILGKPKKKKNAENDWNSDSDKDKNHDSDSD